MTLLDSILGLFERGGCVAVCEMRKKRRRGRLREGPLSNSPAEVSRESRKFPRWAVGSRSVGAGQYARAHTHGHA